MKSYLLWLFLTCDLYCCWYQIWDRVLRKSHLGISFCTPAHDLCPLQKCYNWMLEPSKIYPTILPSQLHLYDTHSMLQSSQPHRPDLTGSGIIQLYTYSIAVTPCRLSPLLRVWPVRPTFPLVYDLKSQEGLTRSPGSEKKNHLLQRTNRMA